MTNTIVINNKSIQPIEINGSRVVTLSMIDEIHQRPTGTARKRFNDNKSRLTEGEDYIVRNSDEAKSMGFTAPNGLTLVTESGYLLLVKSFTDDLAWQIQKQLVNAYFKVVPRGQVDTTPETITPSEQQILQEIVEKKTQGYGDLVGKARAEVWSRVHRKFRVAKYSQLARTQISDVIAYIMAMQIKAAMPAQTISQSQQLQLRDALHEAMLGWCWTSNDRDKLVNALRIKYNIQTLAHLPADKFEEAITFATQAKEQAFQCLLGMAEVKDFVIKEIIMGGAPYTPTISRNYKKQFGALPPVINWAAMQQRLQAA